MRASVARRVGFMAVVKRVPGPGAAKLKTILAGLKNAETKVGITAPSKYEDGTSVAYVAAIQEFGSPKRAIPPRPVFRPTIADKKNNWRQVMERGAKKLSTGMSAAEAMELVGLVAAGDIRKKYSTITTPPLSLVTLRLRKLKREGAKITAKTVGQVHKALKQVQGPPDVSGVSTKPLVFDGILINSITSVTRSI